MDQERKKLLSMITSQTILSEGSWRYFITHTPKDIYDSKLFDIILKDNLIFESDKYKSIKDILNLKKVDLEKIDRFGKRKAQIVFDSVQKSVSNVQLSKLQHATGIFKGLGSKKLVLLEGFTTKPTIDQVMSIEGFAEVSAKSYIDSYDIFFDFINGKSMLF
jgi:hypothetical protein